jgi:hypothetical protein
MGFLHRTGKSRGQVDSAWQRGLRSAEGSQSPSSDRRLAHARCWVRLNESGPLLSKVGQWRKITIMSLVLATSIGLYGFILRMMRDSQFVQWLFFFSSVGLLVETATG